LVVQSIRKQPAAVDPITAGHDQRFEIYRSTVIAIRGMSHCRPEPDSSINNHIKQSEYTPTMFKSLVLIAAAIAPVLVRADFCKATDDVLFFSW
jgi:hypothetical protein